MDSIKELAQLVAHYIKGDKTSPYDTAAKVKRISNGIAYVQIPGGVSETPVKLTIDAKAGDTVQVRVANGTAWLVGNQSAPPTDDAEALIAKQKAVLADGKASTALEDATRASIAAESAEAAAQTAEGYAIAAKTTTDEINAYAITAGKTVTQILDDGETAGTAAQEAKASAQNASEYASRALGNLSTVQSVAETLTWITQHGTMALTTDVALDPTHVYFVVDAGGDYTVGGVTYAIVTEPDVADIGTYYELSIDESLNNYVGTHLALTQEGLWLLPATSGTNKVLIATGAGSTYTVAGTYLIDSSGNTAASFRTDGATMSASGVQIAHLGYGAGTDAGGGTSTAPYYTLGKRATGSTIGNYSVAEGTSITLNGISYSVSSSGYASHAEGCGTTSNNIASHAEGYITTASGTGAHAEGDQTTASGYASHAEGIETKATQSGAHAEGANTVASGYHAHAEGRITQALANYSHAQNFRTVAASESQTALGEYNVEDNANTYACIIGNGTADNARSNALTVAWTGDVDAKGDVNIASGKHYKINGTNLAATDIGAQPTLTSSTDISVNNITAAGDVNIASGKHYKINGTNLAATDIGAQPTITSSTDLTVNNLNTNGKLTAGAINNSLFAVTDVSFSINASSTTAYEETSTSGQSGTTKTGFYPLGVVGFYISTGGAYSRGCYMSAASSGSCTIKMRIQATSTGTKSCTAKVLWVKTTA